MFKFILRALLPLSLFCMGANAAVNPITVVFEAGDTTFGLGGTGTASYLVSVNPSVPSYPLTMQAANLPAWASQITTGGTNCTTAAPTCGTSMSLSAGQRCCLKLSLNGADLTAGTYSLAPRVATTPKATYQGQAAPTAVTVTPVPMATLSVNPTTLQFTENLTGNVTVTNDSDTVAAANVVATIPGGSNISVQGTTCGASLAAGATCDITFTATTAEGPTTIPIAGDNTNTVNVDVTVIVQPTTTISITPAENDPQILTADGTTPLVFTIENIGAATAENITATPPPGWDEVTIVPSAGCASLAQGSNDCTITLTSNTPNLAKQFTVQGTNTGAPISSPYVAFRINGGLVFSVSGTSPNAVAKVISETDNNPPGGIIWSSNGNGDAPGDVSYDILPGIDETSTAALGSPTYADAEAYFDNTYTGGTFPVAGAFQPCDGKADGACNVVNILALYNTYETNYDVNGAPPFTVTMLPTDTSYYAAGICSASTAGGAAQGDWYLPAICELGTYDANVGGADAGCEPNTPNIESNLFNYGFLDLTTTVNYWSSTESSGFPHYFAWLQTLFGVGASSQSSVNKGYQGGVRCSRAFNY